jgi:hypothetical protein
MRISVCADFVSLDLFWIAFKVTIGLLLKVIKVTTGHQKLATTAQ